jgi:hypothetical protein
VSVLRSKVEGKSESTRGLFISVNGFSSLASEVVARGRRANLIALGART